MKRLLIAAFTLLSLTAFAGKPVTKPLTIGSYTSIEASGAITVVMNSRITEAYMEAKADAIDLYVCEVKKGELSIHPKKKITKQQGRITVYLPFNPALKSVELTGATSFVADLSLTKLEVEAEGASCVELTGRVDMLDIDAEGASKITLKGSCAVLTLDAEGASHINASGWETQVAKVDISGASSTELWVTDKLTGEVTGASRLRYRGKPQCAVSKSGASSVSTL